MLTALKACDLANNARLELITWWNPFILLG
jgi:hypothetical protein